MKKSIEDKIRKVITDHEKRTKENIQEVSAIKVNEIGFKKGETIKVTYWTK